MTMHELAEKWQADFCDSQYATPEDFRLLGQLQMLAILDVEPDSTIVCARLMDFILAWS